jgi:hypothetical protein
VNKTYSFLAALGAMLIMLSACKQGVQSSENDEDKAFFPIAGNINAELNEIDSLPIGIIKYTQLEGRSDTSVAAKQELRQVAQWMISPDISSPGMKELFQEDVLFDKTIGILTMSYTTRSDDPPVRKIEVRVDPETEKIRSIFVERLDTSSDTLYNRKLVWVTGKSLQVITSINLPGEPETIKTEKYTWGM